MIATDNETSSWVLINRSIFGFYKKCLTANMHITFFANSLHMVQWSCFDKSENLMLSVCILVDVTVVMFLLITNNNYSIFFKKIPNTHKDVLEWLELKKRRRAETNKKYFNLFEISWVHFTFFCTEHLWVNSSWLKYHLRKSSNLTDFCAKINHH